MNNIKKLLKKLDSFLDRKWRETCAVLFYLADKKIVEKDSEWIKMQKNINKDKKNAD